MMHQTKEIFEQKTTPRHLLKEAPMIKERTHQNEQLSNLQHFVLFVNCTDARKNKHTHRKRRNKNLLIQLKNARHIQ